MTRWHPRLIVSRPILILLLGLALAGCGGFAAGPRSPPPDQERPAVISQGVARTDAATALRAFFRADGLPETVRAERLRAILRAAGEEGFADVASGDVPVQALINDASPAGEARRVRIARNLRLLP